MTLEETLSAVPRRPHFGAAPSLHLDELLILRLVDVLTDERYHVGRRITMPVSLNDLREAFEFVCASGGGEHEAFLCKQSGKLYRHSELCDDLDILPDDIDDSEKFLPIPDKRELDLGKPLALDFARQFLPGDFGDVRQIFSRRGAYARRKPRKAP